MFQWNKLELFWTSTFEVNAKGNCCNAFGTVLVVIKTNGHRLNLFIQIFNFQNIYFPKLIYVHWSCSSFKKPILTWNVVVFVVQLRKSLSLSLYLHVINSFMPLIYGLFPDVQNEDVHSVQKNRRCFNMLRPQLFSAWYCQRNARQWTKRSPLKHGQTNMVFNWWLYFKRIKLLATVRIIVGVSFMICER